MSDPTDLPTIAQAARHATTLGIMVLPSHYPIPLTAPDEHGRRLACSCGQPGCPAPARHPIQGLTVNHATVNPDRVTAWWADRPNANLATPAGRSLDILELACASPAQQVTDWLDTQGIEPGPIIAAAPNRLHLLVRGSQPTTPRAAPLRDGRLVRVAADTLVLLPPSRRIDGHPVAWQRPFATRAAPLPDGERVWEALVHLPQPTSSTTGTTPSGSTVPPSCPPTSHERRHPRPAGRDRHHHPGHPRSARAGTQARPNT